MHQLQISLKDGKRTSDIRIGAGLISKVADLIGESRSFAPRRILVLSNKRVFDLYGARVVSSLRRSKFRVFEFLMPEGERYKSFRSLEKAVTFLGKNGFERNDLVIALGGGVVGDLAGFTAAIYLRGIPFIQIPTTLLAQIDSSVGGKTAINLPFGKNMVGSFYQPPLVLIDPETLATLPRREIVSGFCEMVKQSLVANTALFESTIEMLRQIKNDPSVIHSEAFAELVSKHCSFKASIVANDEREDTGRADAKSRRILNFGHTTAHALEAVTNYRVFRHGEAVGYGLLVAGEISRNLGLLRSDELDELYEAVHLCGPLPAANKIQIKQILKALKHDKKSVAGEVNWVLLAGLGSPRIVSGSEIDAHVLGLSLRAGLRSFGRQKDRSC